MRFLTILFRKAKQIFWYKYWPNENPVIYSICKRISTQKISYHCMEFEVLLAVKVSMLVFWVVTPYGLVGIYQRYERTYCFHLQVQVHTALLPRRISPKTCSVTIKYSEFLRARSQADECDSPPVKSVRPITLASASQLRWLENYL
jgi:hypothetical protein